MNSKQKLFQDLVDDVSKGDITLLDAKEILGSDYISWLKLYEAEERAKKAYTEYIRALNIYKKAVDRYNKASAYKAEKQKAYDTMMSVKMKAEQRFNNLLKTTYNALLEMGKVEEDVIDEPYFKAHEIEKYRVANKLPDVALRMPFTPEEKLKVAFGVKVKPKLISFNEVYERMMKQELNMSKYYTRPFTDAWKESIKAYVEKEEAKDLVERSYEEYVLLKIIGIL